MNYKQNMKIGLSFCLTILFIISTLIPNIHGYKISKTTVELIGEIDLQSAQTSEDGLMTSAWPMFQHNTKHTGRSPYGKSGNWYVIKWKFKIDGAVHSSPVIDNNGVIYIGGWNDFYAINPNGTLKWTYEFRYGYVESAAAIDENGTIYFGTAYGDDNSLFALNPNGTLKWKYRTGNHIQSSPVVGNYGTIYFGSHNRNIYAFYPNGTLRWKYETGDEVEESPAISDDGIIYCDSDDHNLYALYPNGTLNWKHNIGCRVGGGPTIGDDGTIYFGGVEEAAIYAVYPNGTRMWKISLGSNVISSPALAEDGTIYIAAYKAPSGAYIYSINPNGSINWRYEVEDEPISASPAIDKYGIIYIGGWNGDFYALNPNGTLRWKIPTKGEIWSSAAIDENGIIYFGSWDTNLYAIEPIENEPPEKPIIEGPLKGQPRRKYTYTAITTDSDGDNISYFFDWGDGTDSGWSEYIYSGFTISNSHSWSKSGNYTVRVKAKDIHGMEGDWETLTVTMPRNKIAFNSLFVQILEKLLFKINLLLK